jgi:hypothetical protein
MVMLGVTYYGRFASMGSAIIAGKGSPYILRGASRWRLQSSSARPWPLLELSKVRLTVCCAAHVKIAISRSANQLWTEARWFGAVLIRSRFFCGADIVPALHKPQEWIEIIRVGHSQLHARHRGRGSRSRESDSQGAGRGSDEHIARDNVILAYVSENPAVGIGHL